MKVDRLQAQNIYDAYSTNLQQSNPEKVAAGGKNQGDKLEISNKAASMKEANTMAKKALSESDADRSSRIAEIKDRVDTGTYSVSSRDVAKSVLKGLLFDRKV